MPGNVKSMPKSGLPVTIFALSTPGVGLPMILYSLFVLSVSVDKSGGGSAAAFVASAP